VIGPGFLDRGELFALDVFHQGRFQQVLVRDFPHQRRGHLPAQQPHRPQAALPRDQFVTIVKVGMVTHHDGLDHPQAFQGTGKPLQTFAIEAPAGLQAVGQDVRHV
jgi:hypothetical protein